MRYNLDSEVRTKMFGDVTQAAGAWHNGTINDNHIVIFCTEGKIRLETERGIEDLEAGDLLLIPRRTFYKPLAGNGCRYYVMHFKASEGMNAEIPSVTLIAPHPRLFRGYAYTCLSDYTATVDIEPHVMKASLTAKEIFEKASRLRPDQAFADQLLLDHLARELLIDMGRKYAPVRSVAFSNILDFVKEHYAENISLSTLSESFDLSPSYIARLFKRELNKRPSVYINGLRISAARVLLLETALSIGEIAERVGFSDLYYFSKVYKQSTGEPPSATRKKSENVS